MPITVNGNTVDFPVDAIVKHLNEGATPNRTWEQRSFFFDAEDYLDTSLIIELERPKGTSEWNLRSFSVSYIEEVPEGEREADCYYEPFVCTMKGEQLAREDIGGKVAQYVEKFVAMFNATQ